MPRYIVSCGPDSDTKDEDFEQAKEFARSHGGKISHEIQFAKIFYVDYDDDMLSTLQGEIIKGNSQREPKKRVEVEADGVMKTMDK